ncbi:MAG: hypothetical protein J5742_01625 [Alphaproteobacteria bacterium]|nr:hypothetical protein [Alphaproteobacteria bacterium]
MKNQKQFYENATKNLLSKLNDMGLSDTDKKKAIFYTKLLRESFKYDEIKKFTFLSGENDIWDFGYDSAGFCRIASITFSLAMGFQDWRLMCIDKMKWPGKMDHHYLQHVPSGTFFDITYDQFEVYGEKVPYEIGTPTTFGLVPGDSVLRFAKAMDIDIFGMLKGKTKTV